MQWSLEGANFHPWQNRRHCKHQQLPLLPFQPRLPHPLPEYLACWNVFLIKCHWSYSDGRAIPLPGAECFRSTPFPCSLAGCPEEAKLLRSSTRSLDKTNSHSKTKQSKETRRPGSHQNQAWAVPSGSLAWWPENGSRQFSKFPSNGFDETLFPNITTQFPKDNPFGILEPLRSVGSFTGK